MSEIPEVAQFIRELRELRDRIAAREDTVMLAIGELAKQNRELADRVSRLEHARREDVQRIDAHELFIERGLFIERAILPLNLRRANPQDEEFVTIRAELENRECRNAE